MAEEGSFIIKDWLGKGFHVKNASIIKDIILICVLYIFYTNSDFKANLLAFKYILLIFTIRYLLSILTEVRDDKNKRYFQINGHLSIIVILSFVMLHSGGWGVSSLLVWMFILCYSLLIIASGEHYTYDIISTIVLNDYVIRSNLL